MIEDETPRRPYDLPKSHEVLNKCLMGAIHVPQRATESKPVNKNEISFLVFGGLSFSGKQGM